MHAALWWVVLLIVAAVVADRAAVGGPGRCSVDAVSEAPDFAEAAYSGASQCALSVGSSAVVASSVGVLNTCAWIGRRLGGRADVL